MAGKAVLVEGSALTDENKDAIIDEMVDALFADDAVDEEGGESDEPKE